MTNVEFSTRENQGHTLEPSDNDTNESKIHHNLFLNCDRKLHQVDFMMIVLLALLQFLQFQVCFFATVAKVFDLADQKQTENFFVHICAFYM